MLIKRVYEIDPLACPRCGGQMKVISLMESPQGAVIEKVPRHCGLWHPSTLRTPPPEDGWVYEPDTDWDSRQFLENDFAQFRRVTGEVTEGLARGRFPFMPDRN